jgi:hypothetical protein
VDRSCRRVRNDYGVVVASALGEAVVVVVVAGDVVVDAGVVVVVDQEGVDEVGGELEEDDVVVVPPDDDDDDEVEVESVEEPGSVVLEAVVIKPLSCSCVSISC